MTVTRWWWVRHAPVTEDGGCIYGSSDVKANCEDRPAFEGLARMLPHGAVWVTSHLSRTADTAAAIRAAGHPGSDPAEALVERAVAEQNFGTWQGRPRAEVYAEIGDRHNFWLAPAETRPPEGESFVEVSERVAGAVRRLTAAHGGRDIVCVAHGGSIRAALRLALDLPPRGALAFSIDNLSVTRLDHIAGEDGPEGDDGVWRIVLVNHAPHDGAGALASAPVA
ncbi:MAG: histidine phosphatase family protein [Proteobacteria bacterium]|nr:histidine phosphatase family protein [Pseudomonadota bacterium]